MKYLRASIQIVLLLAFVLVPGLTVFASARGATIPSVPCELAFQSTYGSNSATIPVLDDCCEDDVSGFSSNSISSIPVGEDGCCDAPSVAFGSSSALPVVSPDCCEDEFFKTVALNPHQTTMAAFVVEDDPCAPPVNQTCGITLPTGSVVGDMPANEQAFWAPGKISPNVIVNAGTYWVTGEDKDENGKEFYRILVACQYLWVPADTMQPSYQSPWSGQPLPTFPST